MVIWQRKVSGSRQKLVRLYKLVVGMVSVVFRIWDMRDHLEFLLQQSSLGTYKSECVCVKTAQVLVICY